MTFEKNYWKNKYINRHIGWDIGYVSTPIKEYIDQLTNKTIKILIPGAGNAYEAEYLFKKGFKNVFILEFIDEPIQNFIARVPNFPKSNIIRDDFFKHKGQYDLIIEQTFFSSLNPNQRTAYIDKTHELLKEKGKLVGLLFAIDFNSENPPFGGNKQEYEALFKENFIINKLETAYNSIKPRANNELFIKAIVKK